MVEARWAASSLTVASSGACPAIEPKMSVGDYVMGRKVAFGTALARYTQSSRTSPSVNGANGVNERY